jgi:hypothetical protein
MQSLRFSSAGIVFTLWGFFDNFKAGCSRQADSSLKYGIAKMVVGSGAFILSHYIEGPLEKHLKENGQNVFNGCCVIGSVALAISGVYSIAQYLATSTPRNQKNALMLSGAVKIALSISLAYYLK